MLREAKKASERARAKVVKKPTAARKRRRLGRSRTCRWKSSPTRATCRIRRTAAVATIIEMARSQVVGDMGAASPMPHSQLFAALPAVGATHTNSRNTSFDRTRWGAWFLGSAFFLIKFPAPSYRLLLLGLTPAPTQLKLTKFAGYMGPCFGCLFLLEVAGLLNSD